MLIDLHEVVIKKIKMQQRVYVKDHMNLMIPYFEINDKISYKSV